jgi:pimeloyl-ACP methyl ester carboxylesterase
MPSTTQRTVRTPVLEIAYLEWGDPSGPPVVLLHGFPYDVRAYDQVAALLPEARVLVPHLRGYGETRFLDAATLRSGQQAALGADLLDFLDALGIERAVVAGYDWGGRAACVVAALRPDRVAGLVTAEGYNIQDIAGNVEPEHPEEERRLWYQWYLHSERGRRGLERYRDEFCALLWETWSPTWTDARGAFARSSASLHNPDFVDVVVHSYRHRYGLEAGDPRYAEMEAALAAHPSITVPTVVVEVGADGVSGAPVGDVPRPEFTGPYHYTLVPGVGHNVPQEAPVAFAEAARSLL